MKLKIVVGALLFAAAFWLGQPQPSSTAPQSYRVVMTAYTCEANPNNPMYPCGRLRWGGNVNSRDGLPRRVAQPCL